MWGKTSHDEVIMGGMIINVVLDLGGAPLVKLMHLFLRSAYISPTSCLNQSAQNYTLQNVSFFPVYKYSTDAPALF